MFIVMSSRTKSLGKFPKIPDLDADLDVVCVPNFLLS